MRKFRRETPTRDRLAELFAYDPETGKLTHKTGPRGRRKMRVGDEAGRFDAFGYRVVTVDGEPWQVHRLVWKMMTGEEPPAYLDHANRNKADNRWQNLRQASANQNAANRDLTVLNTLGAQGVSIQPSSGKWSANITWAGKAVHLGTFDTAEEAADAYRSRARELHGDFYAQNTNQRVVTTTLLLADEPFIEAVADVRRALLRLRERLRAENHWAAEAVNAACMDLAEPMTRLNARKFGRYQVRESPPQPATLRSRAAKLQICLDRPNTA